MKLSSKAFTLLETAIALAVSGVALTMISFLMVNVNSFNDAKQKQTLLFSEINIFKNRISSELLPYQTSQCFWENGENDNSFTVTNAEGNFVFSFDNKTLQKDSVEICQFSYLSAVSFQVESAFLKCQLNFNDEKTILILVEKV